MKTGRSIKGLKWKDTKGGEGGVDGETEEEDG